MLAPPQGTCPRAPGAVQVGVVADLASGGAPPSEAGTPEKVGSCPQDARPGGLGVVGQLCLVPPREAFVQPTCPGSQC